MYPSTKSCPLGWTNCQAALALAVHASYNCTKLAAPWSRLGSNPLDLTCALIIKKRERKLVKILNKREIKYSTGRRSSRPDCCWILARIGSAWDGTWIAGRARNSPQFGNCLDHLSNILQTSRTVTKNNDKVTHCFLLQSLNIKRYLWKYYWCCFNGRYKRTWFHYIWKWKRCW